MFQSSKGAPLALRDLLFELALPVESQCPLSSCHEQAEGSGKSDVTCAFDIIIDNAMVSHRHVDERHGTSDASGMLL